MSFLNMTPYDLLGSAHVCSGQLPCIDMSVEMRKGNKVRIKFHAFISLLPIYSHHLFLPPISQPLLTPPVPAFPIVFDILPVFLFSFSFFIHVLHSSQK